MKKSVVLVSILLMLIVSFVSAAPDPAEAIEDLQENRAIEKITEFTEKDRWNYLGNEWQKSLLENEHIASIDAFCKKINPVFVIFLGSPYELSLSLVFMIILWILLAYTINTYLFIVKGFTRVIVSIAITVLIAQTKILPLIASIIMKLLFFKKGAGWTTIAAVAIIGGICILVYIDKMLGASLKKSRNEQEKADLKFRVKKAETFIKNTERP